ncbi:hypothetical protein FK216_01735 [Moraxellaceae bacterium AER2_44_116]|nr:hypothetical protein [Moraxellaceae bacterium]TQC99994.1 hypothetical protein FK216_01735 [Moraxellaceae bacterium AER2_44_116]
MNLNDLFSVIDTDTLEQIDPITLMENPVISANNLSNDEANDLSLKSEVKPVIQETVRPSLVAQFEPLNKSISTTDLTHQLANQVEKCGSIKSVEKLADRFTPTVDRPPTWSMDRYAHMVKCQQCEHLTSAGYCRVKPQYKPIPDALIDCASFDALKSERTSEVRNEPYTQSELNALLGDCEKKLFHHFVKGCDGCSFMESRYCVDAFAIGSSYDAMLLVFDDAASKREALLNTVIRARISGRKVFVGIDYTNMGEPPQQTVKPLVYGIGDSERLFVDHLMTCEKCKPVSRTYCGEGVRLQGWLPHQRRD